MQKMNASHEDFNEKGAADASAKSEIGAMKERKVQQAAGGVQQPADKQSQSNGSTMRRMSAESQDFEFNKVGGMEATDDKEGDKQGLCSADELFYKGQLLPLAVQYNMAGWANHHLHRHDSAATATNSSSSTNPSGSPPSHDAAAASAAAAAHELLLEPLSSKLVSRDQDVRFSSSCRMDHLNQLGQQLDPSLFDLRCSSFRSHSSKYSSYYCHFYANYGSSTSTSSGGDSTPINSGESSSSSRDSNGSSQDSAAAAASCTSHPADHHCPHMQREHPVSCCCRHAPHHFPKPKHLGFLQSCRLLLLHGFRRGSSEAYHHSSKPHNIHGASLQRSSGELNLHNLHNHPCSLAAANEGLPASLSCGCKLVEQGHRRASCIKSIPNSNEPTSLSSTGLVKEVEVKTHTISRDKQSPRSNECSRGMGSASSAMNGGSNNSNKLSSSKWQIRRIKPNISMIKARLVGGQSEKGEDDEQLQEKAGWSAKRRVITRKLSLDRKFSQPSLCDSTNISSGVKGLSNWQVSFRFHAASAASASSCPASVRSSPNHSGLLSPPPSTTSVSTMQELHSAVQGAIAHCKQSNSARILPS